eukprot:Platyproteum_vivax@DN5265_c0_g1_i2.p1
MQDVKNNRLRSYGLDAIFNYGALPQTFENPTEKDKETGLMGDGDPLDVVEVSPRLIPIGAVMPIKVLGVFCLIDQGEMDWKIIAIGCDHVLSNLMNGVEDMEKHMPGTLAKITTWFRTYKTFEGSQENDIAFEGKVLGPDYAHKIIAHHHKSWKQLMITPRSNLWIRTQKF